jgi:hypothetical protein
LVTGLDAFSLSNIKEENVVKVNGQRLNIDLGPSNDLVAKRLEEVYRQVLNDRNHDKQKTPHNLTKSLGMPLYKGETGSEVFTKDLTVTSPEPHLSGQCEGKENFG